MGKNEEINLIREWDCKRPEANQCEDFAFNLDSLNARLVELDQALNQVGLGISYQNKVKEINEIIEDGIKINNYIDSVIPRFWEMDHKFNQAFDQINDALDAVREEDFLYLKPSDWDSNHFPSKYATGASTLYLSFADFDDIVYAGDNIAKYKAQMDRKHIKYNDISESEYSHMESLGYSQEDIFAVLANTETEGDLNLVRGLMKGDYLEAFHNSPDMISPSVQIFLSGYAIALTDTSQLSELEKFNNSMFAEQNDVRITRKEGISYGEKYLSMLYAGTKFLAEENALLFSNQASIDFLKENLAEGEFDNLVKTNENMQSLMALWSSEAIVAESLNDELWNPIERPIYNPARPWTDDPIRSSYTNHFCVSHLILSKSGFEYSCSLKLDEHTVTGVQSEIKEKRVTTLTDISKTFLDAVDYKQSKEELEKRQSELKEKYVNEFIVNGLTDTICAVNPLIGYVVKGGVALASENAGKAASSELKAGANAMEKLSDTKIPWKEGAVVVGAAAESFWGYLKEAQELNQELETLKQDQSEDWFGSGACFTTDVTNYTKTGSGIYDAHTMMTVADWSNRGIGALLPDASPEDLHALKSEIVNYITTYLMDPKADDKLPDNIGFQLVGSELIPQGSELFPDDKKDSDKIVFPADVEPALVIRKDLVSKDKEQWICVNKILNGVGEGKSLLTEDISTFEGAISQIEGACEKIKVNCPTIDYHKLDTKTLFIERVE